MICSTRFRTAVALLALLPFGLFGCGDSLTPQSTDINATPPEVLEPEAPTATGDTAVSEPATAESANAAEAPAAEATEAEAGTNDAAEVATPVEPAASETAAPEGAAAADDAEGSTALVPLTFDEFRARVATNPKAKYTLVDAWATWCAPCKENFPHLVQMHRKFADQGLAVASLSLDDPDDAKATGEAEEFLRQQGASFTNVLLKEEFGVGFEKLDINGIPAVFIFDPQGKEVRRFTMDDPENQFTYEEVEKVVADMLAGQDASAAGESASGAE